MIDLESSKIEVSIRDVCYKTESTVLPRFQRKNRHSNGIVFYMKGEHRHDMEGGECIVSTQYDMLYLPYGSSYESRVTDSSIEYYQINFDLYENGERISLFDAPRNIRAPESAVFLPHLTEIYNLYTGKPYGYKLSALSHLLTIISALVREQDSVCEVGAARKRIRAALVQINTSYQESLSVKELAALSGLSVSGLEKNFIKATGMTPIAYRNTVRIEHAKTLLLGGFSIAEACERVGFSDLYFFAKTFKKIEGIPPGKFVRSKRK